MKFRDYNQSRHPEYDKHSVDSYCEASLETS